MHTPETMPINAETPKTIPTITKVGLTLEVTGLGFITPLKGAKKDIFSSSKLKWIPVNFLKYCIPISSMSSRLNLRGPVELILTKVNVKTQLVPLFCIKSARSKLRFYPPTWKKMGGLTPLLF